MSERTYLAHSARKNKNIPAQSYAEHIRNSREDARKFAENCGRYSPQYGELLVATATLAGEFHDLGKLDEENQRVLSANGEGKLPVPHDDAAPAYLLQGKDQSSLFAALICYAHHRGLPEMAHECNRHAEWLRYESKNSDYDKTKFWQEHTIRNLEKYLCRHRQCTEALPPPVTEPLKTARLQMFWRLALSCLADADHGDTSRHYGETALPPEIPLKAAERLAALDRHVAGLSKSDSNAQRTETRRAIYQACSDSDPEPALYSCDAPVGSGKTTAVMVHLLKAAREKGLRRIFVVLPYTNIISQAVAVYRTALVLDGENPEEIIAEHHHRTVFSKPDSRQLTMLWRAPIVVTTAVQFFETLAANMPADLRKLHSLPGSAVFVDEAHAALPVHLWPQAWLWLTQLVEDWGCHFVFASGSLSRFWELPDFHPDNSPQHKDPPILPELVAASPRLHSLEQEKVRVDYKTEPEAMDLETLAIWVNEKDGPRLLILNTVQSAAVVAKTMAQRFGYKKVEHLSTALTPSDREITLNRVRERLKNTSDTDWTLVATSCVEAGVDLSFRVGLRERASLMSLIQIGGRVNRGHEWEKAEVWDFHIQPSNLLRLHPQFENSARVLSELFSEKKVSPEYCKEALRREIRKDTRSKAIKAILDAESTENAKNTDFPKVAKLFKVIDSNTVTVAIEPKLQEQLQYGRWCGRDELQKHSVQIWGWRVEELRLKEFRKFPGLYGWPYEYDTFLGYMSGLLPIIEFTTGKPTII